MMPDGSFGTPYSVAEARGAAKTHKGMDEYHKHLMLWLCDEADRLNKLVPHDQTTEATSSLPTCQCGAHDSLIVKKINSKWVCYCNSCGQNESEASGDTRKEAVANWAKKQSEVKYVRGPAPNAYGYG